MILQTLEACLMVASSCCLAIDGAPVANVDAVQQKMERVAREKPVSVVMKVRRGIRTFFVELQTGWKR